MSAIRPLPYFVGEGFGEHFALQRFLPPITKGSISNCLTRLAEPGSWIIDPFGASPQMTLETAQAGYKTLVICNNPILQFYIEILCLAPKREDFNAALADFAIEKQGSVRLETYLQSLYLTRCPNCGEIIPAQSFIWKKDQNQPKAKIIHCHVCGIDGEFPVDEEDNQRLSTSSLGALHRARALQRVNINPDVLKAAEDVSNVYSARSLNFIFTFLNRIERMDTSEFHKKLLYAILIFLLDEGNSMWTWPSTKSRPKILSTPSQFREENLWLMIDKAIEQWCCVTQPIPFSVWPEMPKEKSGVCMYKGRISGFKSEFSGQPIQFSAACTYFPRPNQALWSLTAVWSGWLWGKNAVLPVKSALERRRFDWYWYTSAVHQTLHGLHEILGENIPFWGTICEAETSFLASTIIAGENAKFYVNNCSMRTNDEVVQILWQENHQEKSSKTLNIKEICTQSVKQYLLLRNEPADEMELTAVCLTELSKNNSFPVGIEPISYQSIKEIQQEIINLLNDTDIFTQRTIHHHLQEKKGYWLSDTNLPSGYPLSDLVETAFYKLLSENIHFTKIDFDQELCNQFPGCLTPSAELMEALIDSYTKPEDDHPGYFSLKEAARISNLENEQMNIIQELETLGIRLGYHVNSDKPFIWFEDENDKTVITFKIITSSSIVGYDTGQKIPVRKISQDTPNSLQVIVFPDFLVGLLEYKINTNPFLISSFEKETRIIHYQQISNLYQDESLGRSDFLFRIKGSQFNHQHPSQISFFSI